MKEKAAEQTDKEKPTDGEFLSGFWKTDRLIPVITLVIYFGADDWDAPLSLKEMYSNTNGVILAHVPNYHVNLITGSKLKYPEGKGDVNMCLAIQQMREESELVGQIKGAVETYKDLEVSLADTVKRIAERFHLSESESSETVKQYW